MEKEGKIRSTKKKIFFFKSENKVEFKTRRDAVSLLFLSDKKNKMYSKIRTL